MIRAALHGKGRSELNRALRDRLPFRTSGALSADVTPYGYPGSGRLSGVYLDTYREDAPSIRYVVRSYDTPIAWVTEDGSVTKIGQKFSVTTSRHQSAVRAWL